MAKASARLLRVGVAAASAAALLATYGAAGSASAASSSPRKGGTITMLENETKFTAVDPQKVYTGEDISFFSATITRSLTGYALGKGAAGNKLVPDMATTTGTSSNGAKTWSFTLKKGLKWQDGKAVTCDDVKYGVSRTFATDVINGGPTYAIQYLDIPTASDGSSTYKGPYDTSASNNTAAFDKAVTCSGQKITFNLNQPVADFNQTVTLGFGAVEKSKDGGAKYDNSVQSDGPYKIKSYTSGTSMVLVRNPEWKQSTDKVRKAYPNSIVIKFGLDPSSIDQRLIRNASTDQSSLQGTASMQTQNLNTVFKSNQYANRRVLATSPYVDYISIDVKKVPNQLQRQAISAALNRKELLAVSGGSYGGTIADGVISPTLTGDYAKSGLLNGLLGKKIPSTGDPAYAKQLIAKSGQPMPTLTYSFRNQGTEAKEAASVQQSLARAGITVKLNPVEASAYYTQIFSDTDATDLMWTSWGADWPSASTVIPDLFTPNGGWNIARVDDATFNANVTKTENLTSVSAQSPQWKALNKQAVQQGWAVPYLFVKFARLSGSKIGFAHNGGTPYLWGGTASWPYADLYVKQ